VLLRSLATLLWVARLGYGTRAAPRRHIIERGIRVRVRDTASIARRPHLLQHARQGDAGIIAGPSRQSPQMSALYLVVSFDSCGHEHRLLEHEIEPV